MSQEDIYDSYRLEANQAFADAILGPPIAGCLVGLILAGAFIQQYFNYLGGKLYAQDSLKIKLLLHAVMGLAVVQSALTFYGAYHYSTWQQRDSDTLFSQTSTDCLVLTFVGIEGVVVQLFLASRGTALMGDNRWRWVYWALVAAAVAGGFAGSVLFLVASILSRAGQNPQFFNISSGLYQICGAFANTLITVTLCVSLRRKMNSFSKQTDSILSALIRVSVESAAPSAVVAVAGAVLGFVYDDESLFANVSWAFFQTLTGLYALSLLAALNGRERVRQVAASQTGTYHFNREVLTTIDCPSSPLSNANPGMLEAGGMGRLHPALSRSSRASRLSGRKGGAGAPATPVLEVGLAAFGAVEAVEARLEKEGL